MDCKCEGGNTVRFFCDSINITFGRSVMLKIPIVHVSLTHLERKLDAHACIYVENVSAPCNAKGRQDLLQKARNMHRSRSLLLITLILWRL